MRHPKFFYMYAASRLHVETVSEAEGEHAGWVSRFAPGPITIGTDGGTVWTPTISRLGGILIVHQRLADEILAAELTGFEEYYPIHLRTDWPTAIHKKGISSAPRYVWFRIRRDIDVDNRAFEWSREAGPAGPNVPYRKVPVADSHGGLDVFGVKNAPWAHIFCTWRFLEKARNGNWKGFQFEPMDVPHLSRVDKTIAYLGKDWPPLRWYPEGVEGHPNNLES